ncbi:class II D-tagatose-bisphosphate aldolase, non-catalytic subunit [uncultured Ruegeria sp.]|uniref:class II D-tagatose-bisphosphate aldolase non-catalytic subunit n=1 Tax=uncultured Ruegeria sp. TaxID=259304 RepID=UPI00345B9BDA
MRHTHSTLKAHFDAFKAADITREWSRVNGLDAQPSLEFTHTQINHFDQAGPDHLSEALFGIQHFYFEARSTDYHHLSVYPDLIRRPFSVLPKIKQV